MDAGGEPPFPELSPPGVAELSEEAQARVAELQQQAADAVEEGRLEAALDRLSEAVALGCASALLYSRRAQVLLQLSRPRAAIHDCTAALGANPACGRALKVRGRALAVLGRWREAAGDLHEALRLDFDEATEEEARTAEVRAKEQEAMEVLAACQLWEIVGGADKGGIIARHGAELTSPQAAARLATGSIVRELQRVGERLNYKKVTGAGPDEGWISISLNDKVLACRVPSKAAPASLKQDTPEEREEPPFPEMAPEGVDELTDAASERQAALKMRAAEAAEEGNLDLALQALTEAIVLGAPSALLYSRRAQALLELGRPRAAANDCEAALRINPDSGKAYKIRARALTKLKRWAEAHSDFQLGLKIDYDDATYEESLAVAAKMKEINAVATERRIRAEEVEGERRLREAEAAREAKLRAEQAAQQAATRLAAQCRAAESRHAHEPFFQAAKKQGWMTDFMGMKRGRCSKCDFCDVYIWRPVRLSS